jgi:type IV pilus assembly protein PilW
MKAESKFRRQTGLTLIELMVAMVVGMLIVLAATSGAAFFEANRRSAMGGNSALENGIATVFNLQKDIQNAGLSTINAPCQMVWVNNGGAWEESARTNSAAVLGLPVQLHGATAATGSDSITINAQSLMVGAPATLASEATATSESAEATLALNSTAGFTVGDTALLVPPSGGTGACFLAQVKDVESATTIEIRPLVGGDGADTFPPNFNWPIDSQVINLGQSRSVLYRVDEDSASFESVNLRVDSDEDPDRNNTTTVLAENVVMLRMQYGVSATEDALNVDKWVNPDSADALFDRLRAIRVAVVARSAQPTLAKGDAECDITVANPDLPWNTGENDQEANELDLDLEGTPLNRCYAYRVSSLTIPLKNYIFGGGK